MTPSNQLCSSLSSILSRRLNFLWLFGLLLHLTGALGTLPKVLVSIALLVATVGVFAYAYRLARADLLFESKNLINDEEDDGDDDDEDDDDEERRRVTRRGTRGGEARGLRGARDGIATAVVEMTAQPNGTSSTRKPRRRLSRADTGLPTKAKSDANLRKWLAFLCLECWDMDLGLRQSTIKLRVAWIKLCRSRYLPKVPPRLPTASGPSPADSERKESTSMAPDQEEPHWLQCFSAEI